MVIRASSVAAILVLAAASARADTLQVPGDAPTIQAAIVAAASGDTILVAPGTYVETIDLLGKQLVIEGTGGAAVTTIDAGGNGSAVTLEGGEPDGTTLRGLTITGGTGTLIDEVEAGGGGLYIGTAHVTLIDCVITDNTVGGTTPTRQGGGMLLRGSTSSATLIDCTLAENSALTGAAIYAWSASKVNMSGCTVVGNDNSPVLAAVTLFNCSGAVSSCLFADNIGRGLHWTGYQLPVADCTFVGNTDWGLSHFGPIGSEIADLRFLGNGLGGAYLLSPMIANSGHTVTRCLFAEGDIVHAEGGGVTTVDVKSCTFDGGHVDVLPANGGVTVRDSIFRGGGPPVTGTFPTLSVNYCDIEGGFAGTGNIDADPKWVDAASHDYRLLPSSPCIDTGDPTSPLDPDGTRADMGAIPFENAFDDLGGGVAGGAGPVVLASHSTLLGGEGVYFKLTGTPPTQPVVLILGSTQLGAAFKGGTLWPNPSVLINLLTNGAGQLTLSTTWPAAIPSGFKLWAQCWFPNVGAIAGFAGSNGVRGTVP